jgi:hypothetical protein
LIHRYASTLRWPVCVVGLRPIARPGGLHHLGPPGSSWKLGPLPLRLVSTTKWAPPSRRESARPYSITRSVRKKLLTLRAKPSAALIPAARNGPTRRDTGRTKPGLPASM